MTQPELQQLCKEWQKRLRLQDWKVVCKFVDPLEVEGAYGNNLMNEQHKTSIIKIVDNYNYTTDFPTTVEETLVHELLHLHFQSFWDADQKIPMEQAIELISLALVGLKQGETNV